MNNKDHFGLYIKKYWQLSLAFMLYMYFYLTAELAFTGCAEQVFGKDAGTVFYGTICLIAAMGFFTFAPLRKVFLSTGLRRRLFLGLGMAGALCTLLAPFANGWIMGTLSLFAMFCAGHIGAALLYKMTVSVREKSIFGLFIAIPYAAAFLLQYLFGFIEPLFGSIRLAVTHTALAAALLASAALLLVYGSKAPEGNVPRLAKKTDAKQYLFAALMACLIISCLFGLMDGIIMNLHAGQQLNVRGWVRLLTIPGMLFAAWTADYKGGRYFPFATLLAMTAAVIAMFLFSTAQTYNAALGSIYLFFSYMNIYTLAVFVRVAHDTDLPDFWASVGRGAKYAMGGLFVLLGSFIFTSLSLIFIAVLYIALLIALASVFYFRGRLAISPPPTAADKSSAASDFNSLVAAYRFTERETELMRLLLSGKSTSAIAEEMFVNVSTVYKYTSAIMAKTETKSRLELVSLFKR